MAENGTETEKKSSPMKLIIIIIIGAIALVAVSMGGVYFVMQSMGMAGGGQAQEEKNFSNEPAIYYPLDPPFVVNFKDRGRTRFLQVSMEVMTRNPDVISAIEIHTPLIRNNILLVLSNHDAETLHSAEGKELIRQEVMQELKTILVQEIGRIGDKVEGLYFTSFVTQ